MNYRILVIGIVAVVITFFTATASADMPKQTADPELDPNCDCTVTEVPAQPEDGPLWGYSDIHEHQFANLAYGGTVFWGSPFDEGGASKALASCDATKDFKTYTPDAGLNNTLRDALEQAFPGTSAVWGWLFDLSIEVPIPYLTSLLEDKGWAIHGSQDDYLPFSLVPWQLAAGFNNNMAVNVNPLDFHDTGGWPDFSGWPRYDNGGHQQMYYEWLERAYKGGLRLMVNLAVNNEVICDVSIKRDGLSCDDMLAVDEQIDAMHAMQDYVDSKCTGDECGWYRIVKTPEEARDVIREGKMAVIIGIEVDALFNCKFAGQCSQQEISDSVQQYYEKDVRYVFLVHFANNQFVGAAVYPDFIKWASAIGSSYQIFNLWDCKAMGYDRMCNAKGLTQDGYFLLEELMSNNMIIDIDHMSLRATGYTDENGLRHEGFLDMAQGNNYPVVSSHASTRPDERPRLEGSLTVSEASMIRDMGGMVALAMPRGKCKTTQQFLDGEPENYNDPEDNQIYGYRDLVALMGTEASEPEGEGLPQTHLDYPGISLMNDFGAFLPQTGPRMDPGCTPQNYPPLEYPFQAFDGSGNLFDKAETGYRTFDFNVDGVAHIGMVPDMLADLEHLGVQREELDPIFNSAEAFVRMWEKIWFCRPDADPPVLSCPAAITSSTTGESGQVFFDLPAAEDKYYCDWWPGVTSDIAPDSQFDKGVTAVTATATDNVGLSSSCQFNVNLSCFGVDQAHLDNGCTGIDGIAFMNIGDYPYDVEVSPGSHIFMVNPNGTFTIFGSDFGAEVLPSPIQISYTPVLPPGSTTEPTTETIEISTQCSNIETGNVFGPFKVDEFGAILENDTVIHIEGAFDPAVPFYPPTEDVIYTISDGRVAGLTLSYTIPAGSFIVDGAPEEGKYYFVSAWGEEPAIEASFDFPAGTFDFTVQRFDYTEQFVGTELSISLQTGAGASLNGTDQTIEFQALGRSLEYEAESPVDCSPNLPSILNNIEQEIVSNPGTELAIRLESAQEHMAGALEELGKTPPNYQGVLGSLMGVLGDLESAIEDGLLDEEQYWWLDEIGKLAKDIAHSFVEKAGEIEGVNLNKLGQAIILLDEGDSLLASQAYEDAAKKYMDAVKAARKALPKR